MSFYSQLIKLTHILLSLQLYLFYLVLFYTELCFIHANIRPTNLLIYLLLYQLIKLTHIFFTSFYQYIIFFVFSLIIQIYFILFLYSFIKLKLIQPKLTRPKFISKLNLLN